MRKKKVKTSWMSVARLFGLKSSLSERKASSVVVEGPFGLLLKTCVSIPIRAIRHTHTRQTVVRPLLSASSGDLCLNVGGRACGYVWCGRGGGRPLWIVTNRHAAWNSLAGEAHPIYERGGKEKKKRERKYSIDIFRCFSFFIYKRQYLIRRSKTPHSFSGFKRIFYALNFKRELDAIQNVWIHFRWNDQNY